MRCVALCCLFAHLFSLLLFFSSSLVLLFSSSLHLFVSSSLRLFISSSLLLSFSPSLLLSFWSGFCSAPRSRTIDVPVPQVMEEGVQVVQTTLGAHLGALCRRLSTCQHLRYGRNRQCGEVAECNNGPSSSRGCANSTVVERILYVVAVFERTSECCT